MNVKAITNPHRTINVSPSSVSRCHLKKNHAFAAEIICSWKTTLLVLPAPAVDREAGVAAPVGCYLEGLDYNRVAAGTGVAWANPGEAGRFGVAAADDRAVEMETAVERQLVKARFAGS